MKSENITIYIGDDEVEILNKIATEQNRKRGDIIREAIRIYINNYINVERNINEIHQT